MVLLGLSSSALASKGVIGFFGTQSGEPALGGAFNGPRGVAVNQATGEIYVADFGNNRVQRFDSSGAFISAWGRDVIQGGKPGDLGDAYEICAIAADCKIGSRGTLADGPGGELAGAQGVAIDQGTGNVYVTEQNNRRVSEFTASGAFVRTFGWDVETGGVTTFEICTLAANCKRGATGGEGGEFGGIELGGIAVGPGGSVYVADSFNSRVQKFTAEGAFVAAYGWDVVPAGKPGDTGTGLESCPASASASAGDCQAGVPGAGLGQFSEHQPTRVAVDSAGTVYTVESTGNERVQRFNPALTSASVFAGTALSGFPGPTEVAVDPASDHVYVAKPCTPETCPDATVGSEQRIKEFESSGAQVDTHAAGAGLETIGGLAPKSGALYASSTTVDHRIYEIATPPPPVATMGLVDNVTGTGAEFHGEVNPTGMKTGYHFEYRPDGSPTWTSAPAVDLDAGNGNGAVPVNLNVSDLVGSTLYHVRLVATKRYLLGDAVAASATSTETTFTTLPSAPRVQNVTATQIADTTATLIASVNPANEPTAYHFEYGSADCSANPCTNVPLSDASIGSGGADVPVAKELTGLQPGTTYHFRVVATNTTGVTEGDDETFTTYPLAVKGLPDGRAYELVTPPDTNGLFPRSFIGAGGGRNNFSTPLASPSGESVVFDTEGGLPGTEGNGSVDAYEAVRGPGGWSSHVVSPSGGQAEQPGPGGLSADHAYALWESGESGSLALGGLDTSYVRLPDGSFDLLGEGSMGADPAADGKLIAPGASHIVFATGVFAPAVQLEPDAPEAPLGAVYDRAPGGVEVVSLLPGNVTPTATAHYQGASADGSVVVFKVEGTLYVRLANATTLEVGGGNPTFAGISRDGETVFYFRPDGSENPVRGDIYAFDTSTEATTPIATGGGSTVVNISADGSHVYFVSTQQLDGVEGTPDADSLYVWDGSTVRFIATLDPTDLTAFDPNGLVNLATWTTSVVGAGLNENHGPANNPSRTTPDGAFMVFQSHASLTSNDSSGHSQVYLYDAGNESLTCVSCNPTGVPASSDAELQGFRGGAPTNALSQIQNVTDDGSAVFFQSDEALVPGDSDGETDVYEWKDGQVFLISSGRSDGTPDFLYGMTPDGHDVFFVTRDALLPEDRSGGAGAIYDARIGGGFQGVAGTTPCVVEDNCQGAPTSAPLLPRLGSEGSQTGTQIRPKPRRCRKGTHRVKRHGRSRCVKKHKGRRSHRNHGGAG
ncbi:MAG TPA: hypothetical protein VIS51_07085 [Solirubrobacterales bacterium]